MRESRVCTVDNVAHRCCKVHDDCYDMLVREHSCASVQEYIGWYEWQCDPIIGVPRCKHLNGRGETVVTLLQVEANVETSCQERLCTCDALLTECIKQVGYEGRKNCT